MKNRILSDQTSELLKALSALSLWEFRANRVCALITAIGHCGELLAALRLLGFACARNTKVARSAAQSIRALLVDADPLDLVFLDQSMRDTSLHAAAGEAQAAIAPDDVLRLARLEHGAAQVLGLASFHRDGFVREAASQCLAQISTGDELPFLLIRANDWVVPVRGVAVTALVDRAQARYAPGLVRNLPLIHRLREARRNDHEFLLQALEKVVVSHAAADALRAGLVSADQSTRRASVNAAIAHGKISLCLYALSSTDGIVRLRCARFLLSSLPPAELCALADELADDRFAVVRREALRIGIDHCNEDLDGEDLDGGALGRRLDKALLDSARSVRQLASYYARTRCERDVAAFYAAHLRSDQNRAIGRTMGRRIAVSLAGLGESGTVEHVALLRSYVNDAVLGNQRAALQAIAMLDFEPNQSLFFTALASRSPGVSRKARELLIKVPLRGDFPVLEKAMLGSEFDHVRKNALMVLAGTGRWCGLYYILLALQAADESLQAIASQALGRWLLDENRQFIQPRMDEARRIRALLTCVCDTLPATQYKDLLLRVQQSVQS